MTARRYLTKTRFKLAVECPTKLFYTGKRKVYADSKSEDEFLQALAEGGFQVGELAKLMNPGGVEITTEDQDDQVRETEERLKAEDVTLFEATIRHGDLLARVDILRKRGNRVELIEVKAKSFDSTDPLGFRTKKGNIESGMLPYLQDIAFQRHVFALAYPHLDVTCRLMMADKAKTCALDGLNQMFRIRRVAGRPVVHVAPGAQAAALASPVLTEVDVDEYVHEILSMPLEAPGAPVGASLQAMAITWSAAYRDDVRIAPAPAAHCARCEFRDDAPAAGMRSGFHECWEQTYGMSAADIAAGTVLDLWNCRKKPDLIERKILALSDVEREDLGGKPPERGMSAADRQWRQVLNARGGDDAFFLDKELVREEMAKWQFPLHFIDFETARVALPFFAGQRPYANIAFQFSHHAVHEDGRVVHQSEFLQTTPGRAPNYEFARALQEALGKQGTVFMWSPHENTTLNAIRDELAADPQPPTDAAELANFLRSLTRRKIDKRRDQVGERAMVDLCDLAQLAFFHPATHGSCSIKKVLPAVLQSSAYLRSRYSQPVYGAAGGIRSLNFRGQVWWRQEGGRVCDPYGLLPPLFADLPNSELEAASDNEFGDIRQGGAATTAYARLQFDDVAAAQRADVEAALKRYCELDTLAMVMVYEAWRESL